VFSDHPAAVDTAVIVHNPNVFPPRVADTRPAKVFADQRHVSGLSVIPFTPGRRGDQ
jgi:hypothetical protein